MTRVQTPRSRTATPRQRRDSRSPTSALEDVLRVQQGMCVCGNLRMAARLVTAYYDAALRPCGIEANQMAMLWVAHAEDAQPAHGCGRIPIGECQCLAFSECLDGVYSSLMRGRAAFGLRGDALKRGNECWTGGE